MRKSCAKNYGKRHTIFVGGIGKSVTEQALRSYFLQFGQVEWVSLQPGRHGAGKSTMEDAASKRRHRGCGLLQMKDEHGYQAVIRKKSHCFQNCLMECRPALNAAERKKLNHRVSHERRKVFVGGLPHSVDKQSLLDYFNLFVAVEDITLIQKEDREHSFCFLLLRDKGAGELLYGKEFTIQQGVTVKCQEALTPQQLFEKKNEETEREYIDNIENTFGMKPLGKLIQLDKNNIIHPCESAEEKLYSNLVDQQRKVCKESNHRPENLRFNKGRLQRSENSTPQMKKTRLAGAIVCQEYTTWADPLVLHSPPMFNNAAIFESESRTGKRSVQSTTIFQKKKKPAKESSLPLGVSTKEGSASRLDRSIGSKEESPELNRQKHSHFYYYRSPKVERRASTDSCVKHYTPFCF